MGGMTSLLLLLWIGVTVSTVVDLHKRIQNGYNCERQFHVIITNRAKDFFCGGSLINDQWILTAAHCWKWDLVVESVHPKAAFKSINILAPPEMYGYDENRIHDIMLLKLPTRVTTTPDNTIGLPDCDTTPSPKEVQLAGFGYHEKETASTTLQCADFKFDKGVNCKDEYSHVFCGSSDKGSHACPGDSGGGAVYKGKIYGLVISHPKTSCDTPIFTDVCKYIKWIKDKTGMH